MKSSEHIQSSPWAEFDGEVVNKLILFDQACALLTNYEGNDDVPQPTIEDFYYFVAKLVGVWEELIQ